MKFTNKKLRLGDILVRQGYINEEQLKTVLDRQKTTKKRVGDSLVEAGLVSAEDIAHALNIQLGIAFIDLRGVIIPQEVLSLVPGAILRKHNVIPIGYSESDQNTLILAMSDPLDIAAQDDIAIITNCAVEPRISTATGINSALDKYFGTDEVMSAAEQYSKEKGLQRAAQEALNAEAELDLNSSPIVQIVRSIIEQAVRSRASDIHLEALENQFRVRYRIDGVLMEKMLYDISLLPAISARIKILGGMDISEKRKPQDGRLTMLIDRSEYDIRVSMLPSYYGEKIVMRLANTVSLTKNKSELGLTNEDMAHFNHILSNPNGILLVTGPTGSGKSTTLYTALSELNSEAVNIITVEDPVEASIPGINQVQVNPKADLTFATALRSILRQDPDIIMIGEIRDYETASIAVQASITGHLVVSTLHTNSAAATITRLLDMGVESYLLADSVVGVIAQRLVRKLCPSCKRPREATADEKLLLGADPDSPLTIYEPGGCVLCGETGFHGRTAVFEIMEITPEIKRIVAAQGTTEQIKAAAVKNGTKTLRMAASRCVTEGVTTVQEMLKVSFEN